MEEQVVKGIIAKIPNGYFKPSGKKVITSTEEIDVNEFSKAQVVDNNLRPENIAKDVKVLGIVGTHEGGGGIDTSDATASSNDLLLGKTAYVDGEKIVGKIQYYTNDKVKVYSYDGTTIATSGKYTPYDLRIELDASLIPSGSLSVTTNGTYDVTKFASVNINVAIPEGYLKPSGTFETSVEGTYNVSTYANATFSVQKEELNVTPSSDVQTLTPSENKFYNKVVVQPIPSDYVIPSGTLEVTENGEHDVATYEKVNVNVASSGEDMLQARINATKSCKYFFYQYSGTNVDFIANLDTSEVTTWESAFSNSSALLSVPPLNTTNSKNMKNAYAYCKKLQEVGQIGTKNATSTEGLFQQDSNLVTYPQLDLSNCTNAAAMFSGCTKITDIKVTNTSNVISFSNFCYSCRQITKLVLDTSSANNINTLCGYCSALVLCDISFYNIPDTNGGDNIWNSCSMLKAVVIRAFGSSYVLGSSAFSWASLIVGADKDGYIYVPRNMIETLSSATNWSKYASKLRALEDYTLDGTTTGELDLAKMGLEELINA